MGGMFGGIDPAMMQQFMQMQGGGAGAGAGAGATASADTRPPKEKYATELA